MSNPEKALFYYSPRESITTARPVGNAGWGIVAGLVLGPIVLMFIAGALTPGQGAGLPLLTLIVAGGAAYAGALYLLKTRSRPR